MRILMLGWEFPPYISGGLGQACYGLTRALDSMGHDITFVLPRPIDASRGHAPGRVVVRGPGDAAAAGTGAATSSVSQATPMVSQAAAIDATLKARGLTRTRFISIPATFSNPYSSTDVGSPAKASAAGASAGDAAKGVATAAVKQAATQVPHGASPQASSVPSPYGDDLGADADRYARLAAELTRGESYDVIHAHDWLTFPAGIMLATMSGKPLVVHVHSTEFDRAGEHANQSVVAVERAGMQAASRVFAVSQTTKSTLVRRYGIAPSKIDVIYNGIDAEPPLLQKRVKEASEEKVVLFLGRITWQKGPEHFVNAAKRVLSVAPNTRFVLAGAGDMALRMMDLANGLGIGKRVHFTGFLNEREVGKVLDLADVFVMPSVSEPFGIAALEALSHQVPVIISRTAGAAEVLEHVLKVDFWDVDDLANKIVAVIENPALATTLRTNSVVELSRLNWSSAAESCLSGYRAAGA